MILIEFLFAPTVPSAPKPQNTQRTVSSPSIEYAGSYARLVWVTSSLMPIVKWFFGASLLSSSKIPLTIAGVNSLEERPYRPPTTVGEPRTENREPFVQVWFLVLGSWF